MSLRRLAGPVFVVAGALHFLRPGMYEAIMPDYLPAHRELVYASGVAEAAGGLALLSGDEQVRRWGARWLIATLVAVFPANLHMALHPDRYPAIPKAALYDRLPFLGVFAAWVLAAVKR